MKFLRKHLGQIVLLAVLTAFAVPFVKAAYQQRNLQVVVTCRASAAICSRFFDSFALAYSYQDTVPNPSFDPDEPEGPSNQRTIPNPESKKDFMERLAERYLLEVASTKEAEVAGQTARDEKKKELEDSLKRP